MFVDNTFAAIFNAIDRQKLYAYVALSGLAINFILNMILIPQYGYIGASWATVATEIGLVAAGWFALRGALGTLRLVHICWKPLIAGPGDGRLRGAACTRRAGSPCSRSPPCAAVIYAAVLVLLRTADDEERAILRRTLGMRQRPPSTAR